jgi:DNA-binding IclR family transcriptional regulator
VVRALRVLKLFDSKQAEWSLNELLEVAGLNKTTLFRLLSALEAEGLLQRSASGNYRLGAEMIALGGRAMRHNPLREVARSLMQELAEHTKERVTLEMLVSNRDDTHAMLVLDEVKSSHLLGINQFIGSRLPIHATSTGKIVLAFLPEEELDVVLQQEFPALTGQTLTNEGALRSMLSVYCEQGYATAMSELEIGLMATAAPIFNYTGEPIAALSIVGPSIRVDEARLHQLGQEVRAAAATISYQLGYRVD